MKTEKRQYTTYEDVYIAVDGKEFTNEADCLAWENSYKCTMKAGFNKLNTITVDPSTLGIPYVTEDNKCYVIIPQSLDDIVLLNAYINSAVRYCNGLCTNKIWIEPDCVGRLLALDFGYDYDYCNVIDLNMHIDNISQKIKLCQDQLNLQEKIKNSKEDK